MTRKELENIAKDRFKEKPIGYEHNFELKIYQDGFVEGYEYCQASTVLTDNTDTLENALNRIAELEGQLVEQKQYTAFKCQDAKNIIERLKAQIEKMKCCEMCKHKNLNWEFSPICEARDKITIENPLTCKCDKWSMRNDQGRT